MQCAFFFFLHTHPADYASCNQAVMLDKTKIKWWQNRGRLPKKMHKGTAPFTKINWYFIIHAFATTQYVVDNTQEKISILLQLINSKSLNRVYV